MGSLTVSRPAPQAAVTSAAAAAIDAPPPPNIAPVAGPRASPGGHSFARIAVHPPAIAGEDAPVQRRRSASRGTNRRTYVLPTAVRAHIFTNSKNGSGFHSVAKQTGNPTAFVAQTDNRNRNTQPYLANHLGSNGHAVVAYGKSMFPDGWNETRVVDVIERAFTYNSPPLADRSAINQHGTTENANRPLPPPGDDGKLHGHADGVAIEGLFGGGGALATAYPVVR